MKSGIHPKYQPVAITCACGNVIETRSTKPGITIEICSNCHPFFTGKQKIVDAAGRVERFTAKYKNVKPAEKKPAAAPAPAARQIIPKVKPIVPLAPPKPSEAGGARGPRAGGAGRPGGPGAGRPGGAGRSGSVPGGPGRAGGGPGRPGGPGAGPRPGGPGAPRGGQAGGARGPQARGAAPKPAGPEAAAPSTPAPTPAPGDERGPGEDKA